jgi:cell division protease FtsH
MMTAFPWLPIGYEIGPGHASGRLLGEWTGCQLVDDKIGQGSILLLDIAILPSSPALSRLLTKTRPFSFSGRNMHVAFFAEEVTPIRVLDLPRRADAMTSTDLTVLMKAYRIFRDESASCGWGESIFLPGEQACIPTNRFPDTERHREIAISIMTGGVADRSLSANQVKTFTRWLMKEEIGSFLDITSTEQQRVTPATAPSKGTDSGERPPFFLAGQPEFTALANEYIVAYVRDPKRHKAMGVRMPNAILLSGQRGAGKTFAIQKLADYLGWHTVEAGLGEIGSIYIHQTAQQLRRLFDAAETSRPALIVMNEIDALMGGRQASSHDHKIEEVSELLRLVEGASERGILVVGTTNRPEAIDSAFLRKGRFDLQIEIKYPDKDQVSELLTDMLAQRPHVPGINLDPLVAKLVGRPVSDIEWTINEAARIAVKARKDAIDDICLFGAIGRLAR